MKRKSKNIHYTKLNTNIRNNCWGPLLWRINNKIENKHSGFSLRPVTQGASCFGGAVGPISVCSGPSQSSWTYVGGSRCSSVILRVSWSYLQRLIIAFLQPLMRINALVCAGKSFEGFFSRFLSSITCESAVAKESIVFYAPITFFITRANNVSLCGGS